MSTEVRVKLESATGEKLTPEGVELGDLLELLRGLRAAILLNAGVKDLERPVEGVSLVALEVGSVVPVLRVATTLERSADEVLDAIEHRDPSRLHRSAAQAAADAFKRAGELKWVVHPGGLGRSARISEMEPFPELDEAESPQGLRRAPVLARAGDHPVQREQPGSLPHPWQPGH